ncbi:MAG: CdaR family protein [Thermoanaerobaculaceae bacterium]
MRLWPRSWGLAFLALALSFGLWYSRALERRMPVAEREVEASLTLLNVPPELVITSDVPRTVLVRLRGPLERLQAAEKLGAVVNLKQAREGESLYPVDRKLVNLPPSVEVVGLSPFEVPLRLEKLAVRHVPVRPTVVGTVAEGFVVIRTTVEPPLVTIRGPSQQVRVLPSLSTDPVVVEGARAGFSVVVGVRSPSPLMQVVEPLAVWVRVEVGVLAEGKGSG